MNRDARDTETFAYLAVACRQPTRVSITTESLKPELVSHYHPPLWRLAAEQGGKSGGIMRTVYSNKPKANSGGSRLSRLPLLGLTPDRNNDIRTQRPLKGCTTRDVRRSLAPRAEDSRQVTAELGEPSADNQSFARHVVKMQHNRQTCGKRMCSLQAPWHRAGARRLSREPPLATGRPPTHS